jgi:hypothetical protein
MEETKLEIGSRVKIIGGKHKKKASFGHVTKLKKTFCDVELQVFVKSKEKGDLVDEVEKITQSIARKNLELMVPEVATMPSAEDLQVVNVLPEDNIQEDIENVSEEEEMFDKIGKDDCNIKKKEIIPGSSDEEEAITFEDLAKKEKAQRKEIIELKQQITYYQDAILGNQNHINALQEELEKNKGQAGNAQFKQQQFYEIVKLLGELCN